MQSASLGALRQYDIAKKALTPDINSGGAKSMEAGQKANPLVKGAQEFSQVFENVDKATTGLADGTASAHSVVEALATAEMALETAVTIRNRVVEAYQELLRMPV